MLSERVRRVRKRLDPASPRDVDTLLDEIAVLVADRQRLRARSASGAALERNRRRIARLQWELSHALIARHRPRAADRRVA